VRRFADIIPYGGLAADARGHIYLAGGRWYQNPVHVFDLRGNLLRTVGQAEWKLGEDPVYAGVEVDRDGHLYVANTHDGHIEVYDRQGKRINMIRSEALRLPWRLAFGPKGHLYVIENTDENIRYHPEQGGRTIYVFEAQSGVLLDSLPAPPGICLSALTFGPNGNFFVGGYRF
jgi:sugar lactone lactonase YvrE